MVVLVLGGLALWPFVMLKRPWALRLWDRFKFFIVLYVAVVIVGALVALVFRWDSFYG